MSSLANKQILLGVTGGIAAYKSAELVRAIRRQGASVKVVMTPGALEFITPLTMQALSGNQVHTELLDADAEAAMGHIELARWADIVLIAPATADFLAKLVQGIGGDLLTTVCLASRSPICVAPAMNQAMWANAATQENLTKLIDRGVSVFGPGQGEQACGDVGMGRMLDPVELSELLAAKFAMGSLAGKKVVITAGPTQEAIDPVRYISNHSSGKMGYAIAEAAAEAGATTVLISGPVSLASPPRITVEHVISALDMKAAAEKHASGADIFIGAAAVADYRPREKQIHKIKKQAESSLVIEMTKNPDIIGIIAESKVCSYVVGFAAETQNIESYARDKLVRKHLDLVVANNVSKPGIGFNSDNNDVLLIDADSSIEIDGLSKKQLARTLIENIARRSCSKSKIKLD